MRRQNLTLPTSFDFLIAMGAVTAFMLAFLWLGVPTKTPGPLEVGVTFSQIYAQDLGLNWRELLTATLDDLKIRRLRLPAYWSLVEPRRGQFDWSALDYQLDEVARRNGSVLLAVGLKLPRWPECWMPEWVQSLPKQAEHAARLEYLRAVVMRYKNHPALGGWQVENEADFPFGFCPPPDRAFFRREVKLVRELDPTHTVATTDSGELATWLSLGPSTDRLGVSVYRVVTLPWGTVWRYTWIPPYWYKRHALLVLPWVKEVFVSEFQMEPWSEQSLAKTPLAQQLRTFSITQMNDNFRFAERMGIREIYFWGVEWWWFMKTQRHEAGFWDAARDFFERQAQNR